MLQSLFLFHRLFILLVVGERMVAAYVLIKGGFISFFLSSALWLQLWIDNNSGRGSVCAAAGWFQL